MTSRGAHAAFWALGPLPALVRKQRRLERQIARLASIAADEKALRGQILDTLKAAGIAPGELVTCEGYDVKHCKRAGNQFISRDRLLAHGVDAAVIDNSVDRQATAYWSDVSPSKGAQVKA